MWKKFRRMQIVWWFDRNFRKKRVFVENVDFYVYVRNMQ